MNIGIVVDNELNHDKRVLREAYILNGNGHKVYALCIGFDGKNYAEINGISVLRIPMTRLLKNTLFFLFNTIPLYEILWSSTISRFIINNKLDILHVHDLYMAKCSYKGIRKSGKNIKLVLDLHENFAYQVTTYSWTKGFLRNLLSRPGLWKRKEKEYLEYADGIVVLSDEFRDHLITKYPSLRQEEFCSVPNVPDVEQMNSYKPDLSQIPFRKRCPILFYFGIVAERRGIFNALDVFADIIKEGKDIDFLIIGPADKKEQPLFSKTISSDELKDRIIYIPWIDLSELPSYLAISDVCIAPFLKNPQHESGVANKIFDYMLGKKPVIATDCLPQQKLIEKYECGIIYRNDAQLKEAILRLTGEPDLAVKMGNNGYLAIVNELNTGKIKEKLLSFYDTLAPKQIPFNAETVQ
jgi:glycosyltransferase involved in cell wall biosynthesis